MRNCPCLLIGLWLATIGPSQAPAGELEPLLETLRSVGPEGAGNPEAARAWHELAKADGRQLPRILAALDGAGPLAANWIRCAVDAVAEGQLRSGGTLPADQLERFVLETEHAPRARRLAYEWLLRVDPSAEERLIPGMLDDPSVELRRDAVSRLIDEASRLAELTEAAKAVPLYRRALGAARDLDQVDLLAKRLRGLDEAVDLPRHFGFIVAWKLIGPFDNTGEKGFEAAYPPERETDLQASCPGKHGAVSWTDHRTSHDYGLVDLNEVFAEEKGVVAYAASEFFSDEPREVEVRASSSNAVKLWLNGTLLAEHDIYHAGSQFDQYVTRARLEPGRNVILLKVCQNEQTQEWARTWGFQLRLCDATGGAVLSTDRD